MQGRADSRKNCFDLNQFYDNLSRIESSLGKAPTRPLTPSHSKNNNPRPKEDEPHNHLAAFKKELHAKTLTKAKIKLDQPYERLRIAPSGLHEEVSNTSDTFKLSELHTRKASEDPFERVRNKLLSWKNQSRKAQERYPEHNEHEYSRLTNTSNMLKGGLDQSQHQMANTKKLPETDPRSGPACESLLRQLARRNEIYEVVERGLGTEPIKSRGREELSIRMQEHFRKHALMAEIVGKFKELSHLQIVDLGQLLNFLRSGQPPSSKDSIVYQQGSDLIVQ